MKKAYLVVLATAFIFLAGFLLSALGRAPEGAQQKKEEKAQKTVGSKEEAKWTETTVKAGSTPENKKALESGKPVTVTGEVVEVSCYMQLRKRGTAHLDCGKECIRNGQPIGIVDKDGTLYIIMAEQHDPRRRGEVDIKRTFMPLLATTVTVSGMEADYQGVKALYVHGQPVRKSPRATTTQ